MTALVLVSLILGATLALAIRHPWRDLH